MPIREIEFANEEIYHIFNKSIDGRQIFVHEKIARRAIETLLFYRFDNIPLSLSHFFELSEDQKIKLRQKFEKDDNALISIICFCLMPNHFHLLLKQKKDNGICKFLAQFQNSFTRYFNNRGRRKGHVFMGQFKAVRIKTNEQLLHISRYIHLNPYASFFVKKLENLPFYPWSSFSEYLSGEKLFYDKESILSQFKDIGEYRKFVFNYADYQKELKLIKHAIHGDY